MSVLKRRISVILSAVLAIAVPLDAQAARKSKEPAPPPKPECGGVDMLAEFAVSDPALYQRIGAEAKATPNGNAVLWKVEKPGAPTSYLFGTVHLTDNRVAQVPPKVKSLIERSKAVILEVTDLSPRSSAAALASAMKNAVFTDGQSLDQLLAPDEFEKVKKAVARSGMPAEAARLFKPWLVTMLMATSECELKKAQSGALVQDMRIAEIARARRIALTGLETAESQLDALAGVGIAQQVDMLRSGLAYVDRTQDLIETMLQLYLKRNISAVWPFQLVLAERAGIGREAFQGFNDELVVARNVRMRDGVLPHLAKGGAFVAVGALHLPGPQGLVELFRQAGYTVTAADK